MTSVEEEIHEIRAELASQHTEMRLALAQLREDLPYKEIADAKTAIVQASVYVREAKAALQHTLALTGLGARFVDKPQVFE